MRRRPTAVEKKLQDLLAAAAAASPDAAAAADEEEEAAPSCKRAARRPSFAMRRPSREAGPSGVAAADEAARAAAEEEAARVAAEEAARAAAAEKEAAAIKAEAARVAAAEGARSYVRAAARGAAAEGARSYVRAAARVAAADEAARAAAAAAIKAEAIPHSQNSTIMVIVEDGCGNNYVTAVKEEEGFITIYGANSATNGFKERSIKFSITGDEFILDGVLRGHVDKQFKKLYQVIYNYYKSEGLINAKYDYEEAKEAIEVAEKAARVAAAEEAARVAAAAASGAAPAAAAATATAAPAEAASGAAPAAATATAAAEPAAAPAQEEPAAAAPAPAPAESIVSNDGKHTLIVGDMEGRSLRDYLVYGLKASGYPECTPENLMATLSQFFSDGHKLHVNGDLIDKGDDNFDNINLLIILLETYPDKVTFQAGNRDLNKMRFTKELKDVQFISDVFKNRETVRIDGSTTLDNIDTLNDRFCNWVKAGHGGERFNNITEEGFDRLEAIDKQILYLKWMLAKTMGAPNAFEDYRKEIKRSQGSEAAQVSDKQVLEHVLEIFCTPQRHYLKLMSHARVMTRTLTSHNDNKWVCSTVLKVVHASPTKLREDTPDLDKDLQSVAGANTLEAIPLEAYKHVRQAALERRDVDKEPSTGVCASGPPVWTQMTPVEKGTYLFDGGNPSMVVVNHKPYLNRALLRTINCSGVSHVVPVLDNSSKEDPKSHGNTTPAPPGGGLVTEMPATIIRGRLLRVRTFSGDEVNDYYFTPSMQPCKENGDLKDPFLHLVVKAADTGGDHDTNEKYWNITHPIDDETYMLQTQNGANDEPKYGHVTRTIKKDELMRKISVQYPVFNGSNKENVLAKKKAQVIAILGAYQGSVNTWARRRLANATSCILPELGHHHARDATTLIGQVETRAPDIESLEKILSDKLRELNSAPRESTLETTRFRDVTFNTAVRRALEEVQVVTVPQRIIKAVLHQQGATNLEGPSGEPPQSLLEVEGASGLEVEDASGKTPYCGPSMWVERPDASSSQKPGSSSSRAEHAAGAQHAAAQRSDDGSSLSEEEKTNEALAFVTQVLSEPPLPQP